MLELLNKTYKKDGFLWSIAQNREDDRWYLFLSEIEPVNDSAPIPDRQYLGYTFEVPDEIIKKLNGDE